MNLIFIFSLLNLFWFVNPLVYSIDNKIENCNNGSKPYVDYSSITINAISDTQSNVNGKLVVTEKISRTWRAGFYGERYDRGTWNLMFQRKFDDFCNHILNPMEFWYFEYQKFFKGKGCPYEKGFQVNFTDYEIDLNAVRMPPSWTGRWRVTFYGSLISSPGYYQCFRMSGDFYDV